MFSICRTFQIPPCICHSFLQCSKIRAHFLKAYSLFIFFAHRQIPQWSCIFYLYIIIYINHIIRKIYLNRSYIIWFFKVHFYPVFILIFICFPPGPNIFVRNRSRHSSRWSSHLFPIWNEHPFWIFPRFFFNTNRPVSKTLITEKFSIFIESGFPHTNSSFVRRVRAHSSSRYMPPIPT